MGILVLKTSHCAVPITDPTIKAPIMPPFQDLYKKIKMSEIKVLATVCKTTFSIRGAKALIAKLTTNALPRLANSHLNQSRVIVEPQKISKI